MGGILFSVIYMRALRKLRGLVSSMGIPLKIKYDPSRPFWSEIAGDVFGEAESIRSRQCSVSGIQNLELVWKKN